MKTLKYFPLIILLTLNIFSQDTIDPPRLPINFNNPEIFDRNFNDTTFILGWNWSSFGRRLDEAMRINYFHQGYDLSYDNDSTFTHSSLYIPNHRKAVQVTGVSGGRKKYFILNAHSLMLYPVITIDSTSGFIPREFDSTGSVFGFLNKNKVRILNSSQDTSKDYHFAMLDKDSVTTHEIVLSNAWKNNILRFLNYDSTQQGSYDYLNLRQMYFAINLKSFQSIPDSLLDDTVLTIRLPYRKLKITHDPIGDTLIYTYSDSLIKFNQISNSSLGAIQSITSNYGQYRGKFKSLISQTTQVFAITGAMLKFSSANPADSSLTLYGRFFCDGSEINNPLLEPDWYDHPDITEYITNLDVELTYHGKLDLGIRYCKFETLQNQRLTYGLFDLDIKTRIDSLILLMDTNTSDSRIHRFYADDEMLPAQWAANRYYNMLVDTLAGLEAFIHESNLPVHYLYATAFKENWNGMNLNTYTYNAAPYIRKGILKYIDADKANYASPRVFNYMFGYAGNSDGYSDNVNFNDTLNSNYETYLNGIDHTIPITNLNTYEDALLNRNYLDGVLYNVEYRLYHSYYKNRGMIYHNKKWWANLWVNSEWYGLGDTTNSYTNRVYAGRPKTGEEIRLQTFMPVLLGAKGLIYWKKSTEGAINSSDGMGPGLQPNEYNYGELTGDELLRSDIIGGDFLNVTNDPNGFHNFFNPSVYKWNIMNITQDRVYLGFKSVRTQIANLNKWIEHNNSLLMSLKLQAWKGKGFLSWYSQAPGLQDSIMKKYINMSETKVRRLSDENYEYGDSVFYDIALHKINGIALDSQIVISCINRRTDPLIHTIDTVLSEIQDEESGTTPGNTIINSSMKFYSTAEFDEFAENGGNVIGPEDYFEYLEPDSSRWNYYHYYRYRDTTYWRDLWWKRQGCREITINFNYSEPNNTDEFVLLHVQELKADDTLVSTWPWWRKERFNNYIDTVIGPNSPLAVKYQGGEGKMFKISFLHSDSTKGSLAYSNQSKLVVYPVSGDTTKVQYHLTNHKPDTSRHGLMSVFYQRSKIAAVNTPEQLIQWEPEICVSKRINYTVGGNNVSDTTAPAIYPSIVVRDVSGNPYVFIVYQALVTQDVTREEYFCHPNTDTLRDVLNPICEVSFQANMPVTGTQISRAIKQIVYGSPYVFGSPVINASKDFNFYAWSDSVCGIGTGFKSPNSLLLTDIKFIQADLSNLASHPSLNVYSSSNKNENNCSMVWQEKNNLNNSSIYYTNLKISSNTIVNFLPPFMYGASNVNNCVMISSDSKSEMPTITRILTHLDTTDLYLQNEIIAWHITDKQNIGLRTINNIVINNQNGNNKFHSNFSNQSRIMSKIIVAGGLTLSHKIHSLSSPVLGQSNSYQHTDGIGNLGDMHNSYLLNFVDNWFHNQTYANGKRIYHLKRSVRHDSDLNLFGLTNSKGTYYPVADGINPHLAFSPAPYNLSSNIWKNNRVFESISEDATNPIKSSPIYFYPFEECPECTTPMDFVGYESDEMGGGISNIKFKKPNDPKDKPVGVKLPYTTIQDTLGEHSVFTNQDTIYTEWMEIDSTAELKYVVNFNDSFSIGLKLQKLSDSSIIDIPNPSLPESGFAYLVYYMVNGNFDEYRMLMIRNDPTIAYTEDTYLEEPFFADTIVGKRSFEVKQNVINLNKNLINDKTFNLSCMPNPAKEILNVAVYANQNTNVESVVLQLYNQQGMLVWENNSRINSTAAIPVDDFSNGMYLIRANITTKDGYYTETSKVLILK